MSMRTHHRCFKDNAQLFSIILRDVFPQTRLDVCNKITIRTRLIRSWVQLVVVSELVEP